VVFRVPQSLRRYRGLAHAFLKNTDDLASEVLTRMLAGRMDTLNNDLRSAWARFVMTLRFRHPDLVAEMRDNITRLWSNHDAFTRSEYQRSRSPNDPGTFDEYLANISPHANILTQARIDARWNGQ
jgi:hypothetical protein